MTRSVPQNLMTSPQTEMHGFRRGVSSKWIRLVYPDNPPRAPKGQRFLQLHCIFGSVKFDDLLTEDFAPWMVVGCTTWDEWGIVTWYQDRWESQAVSGMSETLFFF